MKHGMLFLLALSSLLLTGTSSRIDSQQCANSSTGYQDTCELCSSVVIITTQPISECGGCMYSYSVSIICPGVPYSSVETSAGTVNCGLSVEKRYTVDNSGCEPPAVAAWEVNCYSCPD